MNKLWMMLVVGCLLVACGGGNEAAKDNSKPVNEPETEREETVFDPMISTMDRAAGVQGTSDDRKSRMDEAIEGAE